MATKGTYNGVAVIVVTTHPDGTLDLQSEDGAQNWFRVAPDGLTPETLTGPPADEA